MHLFFYCLELVDYNLSYNVLQIDVIEVDGIYYGKNPSC